MHEVFLPIMIMVFTLAVMLGLVVIFAGWMAERDKLISGDAGDSGSSRPHPAE